MTDEQFKLLMEALLKIIELLDKPEPSKGLTFTVESRGVPHHLFRSFDPEDPPEPLVEAIGKPL